MKLKISIFIFFLYPLNFFSQIPATYSFSELHNFPTKTIYFSYEDNKRNIWLGTDEGLFKWNGNDFQNYQNTNFSINYSSIQEDKTGRIWCLNFTGQLFYVHEGALVLFADENKYIHSTFNYNVSYFPEIFITSSFGLIEYDFNTKLRQLYSHKKDDYKTVFVLNNKDTLFYNPVEKLTSFDKGLVYWSRDYLVYKEDGIPKEIAQYNVKNRLQTPSIINCNDKLLFVGNVNENEPLISEYSKDKVIRKVVLDFKGKINPSAIYYDNELKLFFIGSQNGVIVLDENYRSVYKQNILEGKNISGFTKDVEGNYWITTLNNGVFIIPSLDVLVNKNDVIKGKQIAFIIKGNEDVIYFVGKYGEIFQKKDELSIDFIGSFNEKVENVIFNPHRNELYAGNVITSFNLNTMKTEINIYGKDIKSISFLNSKVIVTSSSGSSQLRKPANYNTFKKLVKPFLKNEFHYNHNNQFLGVKIRFKRSSFNSYDSINKIVYISYSDGIYYYKNGVETELIYEQSPLLITAMSKVYNETFWLTTINGDLLKINKEKITKPLNFKIKAKNILQWKNYLFIYTNSGVIRINTETHKKKWINTSDGLPSNDIFDMKIIGGMLYLATAKGLVILPYNYNYINKTPPLASILKVVILEKDTALLDEYDLDYNQNSITFYFGAKATRSKNIFTYKYRMLGIDTLWRSQKSKVDFVRFPTMPPGDYTFQLKVINEDSVESDVVEVDLKVDSPFYKKWWFYVLLILLLTSMVSIYFLIRIKIIRKQNEIIRDKKEIEKQLSQSQLAALRSQMNPHFIFNALNSIQDYIISNNKEMASDYLGLFADLMRKYLYYSNEVEITLEEEIETLKMYLKLEKVRFEDTFIYHITADPSLNTIRVKIPVMLVQPFVENAIKHGLLHKKDKQELLINFNKENESLIIRIKDNGIGRKLSAEISKRRNKTNKSTATSAQQEKINLLNQQNDKKINVTYVDLYNNANEAEGTLVEIHIPL